MTKFQKLHEREKKNVSHYEGHFQSKQPTHTPNVKNNQSILFLYCIQLAQNLINSRGIMFLFFLFLCVS